MPSEHSRLLQYLVHNRVVSALASVAREVGYTVQTRDFTKEQDVAIFALYYDVFSVVWGRVSSRFGL